MQSKYIILKLLLVIHVALCCDLFASPDGEGNICTASVPCLLEVALLQQDYGVVCLFSGTYYVEDIRVNTRELQCLENNCVVISDRVSFDLDPSGLYSITVSRVIFRGTDPTFSKIEIRGAEDAENEVLFSESSLSALTLGFTESGTLISAPFTLENSNVSNVVFALGSFDSIRTVRSNVENALFLRRRNDLCMESDLEFFDSTLQNVSIRNLDSPCNFNILNVRLFGSTWQGGRTVLRDFIGLGGVFEAHNSSLRFLSIEALVRVELNSVTATSLGIIKSDLCITNRAFGTIDTNGCRNITSSLLPMVGEIVTTSLAGSEALFDGRPAIFSIQANGDDLEYEWRINNIIVPSDCSSLVINRMSYTFTTVSVIVESYNGVIERSTEIKVKQMPDIWFVDYRNYNAFVDATNIIEISIRGVLLNIFLEESNYIQIVTENTTFSDDSENITYTISSDYIGTFPFCVRASNPAGDNRRCADITFLSVFLSISPDVQHGFIGEVILLYVRLNSTYNCQHRWMTAKDFSNISSWISKSQSNASVVVENVQHRYFVELLCPGFTTARSMFVTIDRGVTPFQFHGISVDSNNAEAFSDVSCRAEVTSFDPEHPLHFRWERCYEGDSNCETMKEGEEDFYTYTPKSLRNFACRVTISDFIRNQSVVAKSDVITVLLPVWIKVIIALSIIVFMVLCVVISYLVYKRIKERNRQKETLNELKMSLLDTSSASSRSSVSIWVPSDEFNFVLDDDLPIVISKKKFDFNTKGGQLKVGQTFKDCFTVRRSLLSQQKSILVRFHPQMSEKYIVDVDPIEFSLQNSNPILASLSLRFNMTAKVSIKIGIELPQLKKYSYLEIKTESELSPWIDMDDVIKGEMIGQGGFGAVFRATYRGRPVALKLAKVQDLDEQTKEELDREVDLMSSLKHPNIVQFIGASKINEKVAILMELMKEGDLATFLQNRVLSLKQKIQIAIQIVEALYFLHHNGIIHRDVKPENILIQSVVNDFITIKIADFGTSRTVTDHFSMTYTKNVGTPIYMAPEILQGKRYESKADTYSFGILLWSIMTQQVPYERFKYPWEVTEFVLQGKRPSIPEDLPYNIRELIERCWEHNPENRPSMQHIINTLEISLH